VFVTGQSFFFLQFRSIIEFLRLFNFFTIFFYSVLIVFIFSNIECTSHIRFKHLITTKEYRINNSMKKLFSLIIFIIYYSVPTAAVVIDKRMMCNDGDYMSYFPSFLLFFSALNSFLNFINQNYRKRTFSFIFRLFVCCFWSSFKANIILLIYLFNWLH